MVCLLAPHQVFRQPQLAPGVLRYWFSAVLRNLQMMQATRVTLCGEWSAVQDLYCEIRFRFSASKSALELRRAELWPSHLNSKEEL
jgi:hypothetical protein